MTKSQVFKSAHETAQKTVSIVGDYMIAFSLALKSEYIKMNNEVEAINQSRLLKIGGKLWKKNNKIRVYLNAEAVKSLVSIKIFTAFEEKSLKKAKTFFDVDSNELRSDVGTVRVILNRSGFTCTK